MGTSKVSFLQRCPLVGGSKYTNVLEPSVLKREGERERRERKGERERRERKGERERGEREKEREREGERERVREREPYLATVTETATHATNVSPSLQLLP